MCFPSELETVIGQSGENFKDRNLPYIDCLFEWTPVALWRPNTGFDPWWISKIYNMKT